MTRAMTFDELFEAKDRARGRADDRALDRVARREDEARRLIGELQREGATFYYINLLKRDGTPTGKIKESRSRFELLDYLLRNRYV